MDSAQAPQGAAGAKGAGFSADVYLAANEPPTFQVDGDVIVGVFVSADEWFHLQTQIAQWAASEPKTRRAERQLLRTLTRASFPHRWWQLWRTDVWAHVVRLPYAAQTLAVQSFTEAQRRAQEGPPVWATEMARRLEERRTNGIASPA